MKRDYTALYELYQAGRSLRQIESDTGVPYHTLFYHFRKCGYVLRSDSEAMNAWYDNAEETARMYADYQTGMSVLAVGLKYYYSPTAVWKRFKDHGLETRKRGAR